MKYFYDTEFLEDGSTIDLISIGIVCEDGSEYYAVNADMDKERIKTDKWLCENVIRHLPLRGKMNPPGFGSNSYVYALDIQSTLVKPKWVIANEVREFLLKGTTYVGGNVILDAPELWAYYSAYDHVALAQLWGKMIYLPKGIPMWTRDLMALIQDNPSIPLPKQGEDQHNALTDARWNWLVYRGLTGNPS